MPNLAPFQLNKPVHYTAIFQSMKGCGWYDSLPAVGRLTGIIHENDNGKADSRRFHTESTECFVDGIIRPLGHRVHGDELGASPRSLCIISVTSV